MRYFTSINAAFLYFKHDWIKLSLPIEIEYLILQDKHAQIVKFIQKKR